MENQKYKEMFQDMLWAEDFDFGFVSGSPHKFYIKAAGYRITWDRVAKTIMLPDLFQKEVVKNDPNTMWSASVMIQMLKHGSSTQTEYYIPTSQEDEFQSSTARVGNILPYELVEYLERLLSVARECILQYSIDERKYK